MEVKFDSDITQMQDGKKAIIKFESIPDTAVELATELNQVDKEIVCYYLKIIFIYLFIINTLI